jgi:hypothetical protein
MSYSVEGRRFMSMSFVYTLSWWRCRLLLFLLATTSLLTAASEPKISRACVPPHGHYPFCNVSLPLLERLDDLIDRLTLEEKPFLLTARESPKGNISRLGIPECKVVSKQIVSEDEGQILALTHILLCLSR